MLTYIPIPESVCLVVIILYLKSVGKAQYGSRVMIYNGFEEICSQTTCAMDFVVFNAPLKESLDIFRKDKIKPKV